MRFPLPLRGSAELSIRDYRRRAAEYEYESRVGVRVRAFVLALERKLRAQGAGRTPQASSYLGEPWTSVRRGAEEKRLHSYLLRRLKSAARRLQESAFLLAPERKLSVTDGRADLRQLKLAARPPSLHATRPTEAAILESTFCCPRRCAEQARRCPGGRTPNVPRFRWWSVSPWPN